MRITQEHIDTLYSAEVVDQNGDKVGSVGQVYLDDHTGAPAPRWWSDAVPHAHAWAASSG